MSNSLEVLFAPAEFSALRERDLSQSVCVVFDVLRATSTMMTALANGALEIIPVAEIPEALALRQARPNVLLAGERHGVRILSDQTGGTDFDLGNSPREFTSARVRDKTLVMSTTNGTRALRACASASRVLIGSFLGLGALATWIHDERPTDLLLICAGTIDQASYEETLADAALCDLVCSEYEKGQIADSAVIARQIYHDKADDLLGAMTLARNGRRLLANPELRDDVSFCVQRDTLDFLAHMSRRGVVEKLGSDYGAS